MRKILFIVGTYLPKASANGICVSKVAEQLINEGYSVDCLCMKNCESPAFEIIDGVGVYRINGPLSYRFTQITSKSKQSRLLILISYIIFLCNRIKVLFLYPIYPLTTPLFAFKLFRKARQLYLKEQYDVVVPVFQTFSNIWAGAMLKKCYPKIKLILYYLDILSGGVPPKVFSDKWLMEKTFRWEKLFFDKADLIIIMKSYQKHYNKEPFEKYQSKIYYGDFPLLVKKDTITKLERGNIRTNCRFVLAGLVQRSMRNPDYLFTLLTKLNRHVTIQFDFCGRHDCQELVQKLSKDLKGVFYFHGQISTKDADKMINDADILLSIGNSFDTAVPSKIFSYMSTGKPILHVYSSENDSALCYLKQYPLSILIYEDWNKIDENTEVLIDFIKKKYDLLDFNTISNMFPENTPGAFIREIVKLFPKSDSIGEDNI